jgi:hypothetical protein
MRIYQLSRNPKQWSEYTLYVIDHDTSDRQAKTRRVLPLVVGSDGWSGGGCASGYAVSMTLLLDYFGNEENCERKAATMGWALANRLTRVRRYSDGGRSDGWVLTEAQVSELVAEILVTAKELIQYAGEQIAIEEVCGERRDLLRQAALVETVSDRRLLK